MVTAVQPGTRSSEGFVHTRRGRVLIENLTAYLFLAPAGIIIFLFGLFPVGFAVFVSLHRWRRFPEGYRGMDNYVRALGEAAYVLFAWVALGALAYGVWGLVRLWRERRGRGEGYALWSLVGGLLNAGAALLFVRWFALLLPVVLDIPQRIRGQELVRGLFVSELFASFQVPEVAQAGNVMLASAVLAAVVSAVVLRRLATGGDASHLLRATVSFLSLGVGWLVAQLTVSTIEEAIASARAEGTALPLWSQIVLISLGAGCLLAAYFVWQRAGRQYEDRRFAGLALVAVLLALGGYLLVAELPTALANADRDFMNGFSITVMFALGTVPVQLTVGMVLAVLLFQDIKGRAAFRVIYFLPYITPFVATSVVFQVFFSHRPQSIINQIVGFFGIPPQKWLLEPTGVFRLMFGPQLPDWLAGPGLALVVIMIYTTWTYIGYDAVVFLAGLGNIPGELYEAARIDGASSWTLFRHVTFPLLSPTTFFLMLIAIIGTFKAFTQIWIMRLPAAYRAVDTVSVHIFETFTTNNQAGYGSAMAVVLLGVILLLTLLQNRVLGQRVFYQ